MLAHRPGCVLSSGSMTSLDPVCSLFEDLGKCTNKGLDFSD